MSADFDGKKVDENWKEQMEKERQAPRPSEPPKSAQPQPPPPQPRRGGAAQSDFSMFLSSLSMQAMIALGEVVHPATGLAQPDPEQARYLIDILGLLQEKTQGKAAR